MSSALLIISNSYNGLMGGLSLVVLLRFQHLVLRYPEELSVIDLRVSAGLRRRGRHCHLVILAIGWQSLRFPFSEILAVEWTVLFVHVSDFYLLLDYRILAYCICFTLCCSPDPTATLA